MDWTGGQLVKINRFAPSSQTCSSCGCRHKISLSVRTYICPACGLIIDRDYNAALNIKAFGIKILEANTAGIAEIYACGDTSIGDQVANWSRFVSLKQEAACSLEPR